MESESHAAAKPSELNALLGRVTGEQVRDAMVAENIARVMHHDCGICGEWTFYERQDDHLFYSSACGCSWSQPQWCDWSDAADWINMQRNEQVRADLLARFGLVPNAEAHAPADPEPIEIMEQSK